VCAAILRTLVKRGLRLEPGLLCVIDGAKGLRTAIRMDRWRTSDQKQRWGASALSLIEPRLRRIKGYGHLPQLRVAWQAKTGKAERVEGTCIA
jgi:hypothetical protein